MQLVDLHLSEFKEREEDLRKIERWSLYPVMYYRPTLLLHSKKIFYLVGAVREYVLSLFPTIDIHRTQIMALVHDDAEIVTGDIQAGNKANMSKGELAKVDEQEEEAIERISKRFPRTIGGYLYKELLLEILHKNTIEAQIVKYLDHLDALCEALHELLAGNHLFAEHMVSEYGVSPIPTEFYIERFNQFQIFYPLLEGLLGGSLPFLKTHSSLDAQEILKNTSPHNESSFRKETNIPMYNWWKNVLLEKLTNEEVHELLKKKNLA